MSLLGSLIASIATSFFTFIAAMVGAAWAVRITAAVTLGGIYVSLVVLYTSMIGPWLANMFSTSYGALLGLLFPPVAGTVTAAMALFYTSVVSYRYLGRLMKMAVG